MVVKFDFAAFCVEECVIFVLFVNETKLVNMSQRIELPIFCLHALFLNLENETKLANTSNRIELPTFRLQVTFHNLGESQT